MTTLRKRVDELENRYQINGKGVLVICRNGESEDDAINKYRMENGPDSIGEDDKVLVVSFVASDRTTDEPKKTMYT